MSPKSPEQRPIVLTDLDDTLFQTSGKCPPDQTPLTQMSTLRGGEPSGFATPRQTAFIAWLQQGDIIPVTNRAADVLARVNLEWKSAICCAGATIIKPDGNPDRYWRARIRLHSNEGARIIETYEQILAHLGAKTDTLRHWTVKDDHVATYICLKSNSKIDPAVHLAEIAAALPGAIPTDWRIHHNGNNIAVIPPWFDKRQAARHLLQSLRLDYPDRPVIAVGDSHSDTGFMDLADFAIMPTRSQIWAGLRTENPWIPA